MPCAISPRLKHSKAITPPLCFAGGLMRGVWAGLNVPHVDTFLEMPSAGVICGCGGRACDVRGASTNQR
jgi:hypothetical protein